MKIVLLALFLVVVNCSAQCLDPNRCVEGTTGSVIVGSKPEAPIGIQDPGMVLPVIIDPLTPPPVTIEPPITPPVTVQPPVTPPVTIQPPVTPPVTVQPPITPPVTIQPPTTPPVAAQAPTIPPVTVLPCASYRKHRNGKDEDDEDNDEKICTKCNPGHFGKSCTCKILPNFSHLEQLDNDRLRAWWGYSVLCNGTFPRSVSIPLSDNNHFKSGKSPLNYNRLQCEGKNYSAVFYTEYDSQDVSDTWKIGDTSASFNTNNRNSVSTSDANVSSVHVVLLTMSVVLMAYAF